MMNKYLKNIQGQGMSEYLILTFLVAVGAIAATHTLKTSIDGKMREVSNHISNMSLTDGGRGSGQGSGGGPKNAIIDLAKGAMGGIFN